MIATPAELFADAEVRARTVRYLGEPAHPVAGPNRAALLAAIAGTPQTSPTGEEPTTTQGVHHVHLSV